MLYLDWGDLLVPLLGFFPLLRNMYKGDMTGICDRLQELTGFSLT